MKIHKRIWIAIIVYTSLLALADGLKVLIATPCMSGHLIPLCSLGRALVQHNHQVDLLLTDDCCSTKVSKVCSNISNCYSTTILPDINLPADDPFKIFTFFGAFAENITKGAFNMASDHLRAHTNYDVIVDDFLLPGVALAGELFDIPVIANVLGHISLPVQGDSYDRQTLPHLPRLSKLPGLISELINHIHFFVEDYLFSRNAYNEMNEIQHRNGLKPAFNETDKFDSFCIFAYYYYHSHIVHTGPADIVLTDINYIKYKNNMHHVGFVPDKSRLQPLAPDLHSFIEKSEKPVVYMSLGTVCDFNDDQLNNFYQGFSSQGQFSVIWALPSSNYKEVKDKFTKTDNFILVSGVPQLSVLANEKVKVFLTHAGANGMQEAVYSEKPLLVFPNFGDQPMNAYNLVRNKVALELDDLTFPEITKKLNELLEPKFYQQAKKRLAESKKFMDKLGGDKKTVEVIEQVAEGKVTLIEPLPLINFREEFKKQLAVCVLKLLVPLCLVIFLLITCCKKLRRKTKAD